MDFVSRTDPELVGVLDTLEPVDFADLAATRAARLRAIRTATADGPAADVERSEVRVAGLDGAPDVTLRVYRPVHASSPLPCLYWIHGGGHVLGSLDQDDAQCEHFVTALGCVVVSVEWRQAPENPYPAEIDDCHAGLVWTAANAGDLGVDAGRIVVGGRSSGGGAAAGLALLARDRGGPSIHHQLLIYPMLDDRARTRSSRMEVHPGLWTREANAAAWEAYLGDTVGTAAVEIYAAPGRAGDLSGAPSCSIFTAELDLFRDEDVAYASRLFAAGVRTELHVYPAAYHGFDVFVPTAAVSRRAARDIDDALARALRAGG